MKDTPGIRDLTRQIERLSAERISLFSKAGGTKTLSDTERQRLREIEVALDEGYKMRRVQRAQRDSQRFNR